MNNSVINPRPADIWRQAILPVDATIQQALRNLDEVAIRIVLVVNAGGKLEGTISDGDIRRGLLSGLDLNSPISSIVHHNPQVVPPKVAREVVLQLMHSNNVQKIPIVDEQQLFVGLHL